MTTVVALVQDPILRFVNNDGSSCVGGMLLTQVGGLNYPTYSDSLGTIQLPNPIVLNARGEIATQTGISSPLFVAPNVAYTYSLYAPTPPGSPPGTLGNLIWSAPNITSPSTVNAIVSGLTQSVLGNILYPPLVPAESSVTIINASIPYLYVTRYGATGLNIADDFPAISAAITVANNLGGGDVIFPVSQPAYLCSQTLIVPEGVRLVGQGNIPRWRQTQNPCKVNYTGSGAAVTVIGNASPVYEACSIVNIQFDGTNSQAGCNGLYLNGTGGTFIEGCLFDQCAFTNFPNYQVLHDGTIFDIEYRRCNMSNPGPGGAGTASSDCVHIQNGTPSQITFNDCFIAPYSQGTWGVNALTGADLRFFGGTVAPYCQGGTAGAHGIFGSGGLYIYGTHIENISTLQTGNYGIVYNGADGAFISPSLCTGFGTGITIGQATSAPATGWTIAGQVSGYNAGGTADIFITNGGLRNGTILSGGWSTGTPPVVLNNRATIDGVWDVNYLYNSDAQIGGNFIAKTIGTGIKVAEGLNAKQGVSTLAAGTVVVANTSVTATSRIQLTVQSLGTVTIPSALAVSARTAGTSFTILASANNDTSIVAWEIFEKA
jgi:Pectate lyase superfamily protein